MGKPEQVFKAGAVRASVFVVELFLAESRRAPSRAALLGAAIPTIPEAIRKGNAPITIRKGSALSHRLPPRQMRWPCPGRFRGASLKCHTVDP